MNWVIFFHILMDFTSFLCCLLSISWKRVSKPLECSLLKTNSISAPTLLSSCAFGTWLKIKLVTEFWLQFSFFTSVKWYPTPYLPRNYKMNIRSSDQTTKHGVTRWHNALFQKISIPLPQQPTCGRTNLPFFLGGLVATYRLLPQKVFSVWTPLPSLWKF